MSDTYSFFANPTAGGLSYEQLKQRRAIAQALASRSKGFPKNVGEGMTYLGESIGEGLQDMALRRAEADYRQKQGTALGTLRSPTSTSTATTTAPPVTTTTPPPVTAKPVAAAPPADDLTTADVPLPLARPADTSAAAAVDDTPAPAPAPTPAPAPAPAPDTFNERFAPTATGGPAPAQLPPFGGPMDQGPSDFPDPPAAVNSSAVRDKVANAMVQAPPTAQDAPPVALPVGGDVPFPHGDPRTTGGVRATMEAELSRGGLTPTAIAGVERNVRDESNFNPNLRHADQPRFSGEAHFAHGLYQEGGDEWNNYTRWIDKNMPGADWRDPALQSRFLAERLGSGQYADTAADMNTASRPGIAADAFLRGYLKPAAGYLNQRSAQYLGEDGGGTYANRQIAQGGDPGSATPGARISGGGGGGGGVDRSGGAPVADDTRDLVTEALLAQPQQKQQQQAQDDSQGYLPDVMGTVPRTTLPQRPTASLGRNGVQSDVSLPVLNPMGRLNGAAPPPAAPFGGPASDQAPDPLGGAISQTAGPVGPQGFGPMPPQQPVGNPPTLTDIQPMPTGAPGDQFAQAQPQRGAPAQSAPPPIPGPLDPPVPRQMPAVQALPKVPAQFDAEPVRPPTPQIPPISQAELRAQKALADFPDDPVIQQRAQQALADAEKQRLMPYQRDIEQWKADMGVYNEQYKTWQDRKANQPQTDIKLRTEQQDLADKQAAAARSNRLGGIDPKLFEGEITKSMEDVKGLPATTQAIANVRSSLKDKMFTGSAANMELALGKIAAAAGFPTSDRVSATEAFKAYMSSITAQARKALVGGTNISDRDLSAAQDASAGKITLEAGSINRVLDSIERINTATAVNHQGKLQAFAGDDPNAQRAVFGVFGLPMENIVPAPAIKMLRDHADKPEVIADFDKTFKTPGLAQRILQRR